jgi:type I restriction enzyme, S subunit
MGTEQKDEGALRADDTALPRVQQLTLGDLCEVTAGPSGSLLDNLHNGPDGVPVISPPDLTDHGTVDTRRIRRVPLADAARLSRFALRDGDLVIVRQGTLGRLALIGMEHATWFYSSSCLRIRPKSRSILPEYLQFYLSYPPVRSRLLGQALPGTVALLNSSILNELPIIVLPLEQQQAIVETLTDLDAQIAIQRAIVDRLESLRPAIFGDMLQRSRHA